MSKNYKSKDGTSFNIRVDCAFLIALVIENLRDETVKAKIRNGFDQFDRVSEQLQTITFANESFKVQY